MFGGTLVVRAGAAAHADVDVVLARLALVDSGFELAVRDVFDLARQLLATLAEQGLPPFNLLSFLEVFQPAHNLVRLLELSSTSILLRLIIHSHEKVILVKIAGEHSLGGLEARRFKLFFVS